jgi:hypothetical protein
MIDGAAAVRQGPAKAKPEKARPLPFRGEAKPGTKSQRLFKNSLPRAASRGFSKPERSELHASGPEAQKNASGGQGRQLSD